MNHWLILFIAGFFEVVWAVTMKYSCGFTRLWPSLAVVFGMALSVGLLALAMRTLPLGTAYAVWTGIGAVGTVLYGMCIGGESTAWPRLLCLVLTVSGIVGLKLFSGK